EAERRQFLAAIGRETRALADVARNLIGQFETSSRSRSSVSPAREIDDLIIEQENHFPELERVADDLRVEIERAGPFGIATLTSLLGDKFGVTVVMGGPPTEPDYPGQYRFDPSRRVMWFHGASTLATRQFQLARL